MRHYQEGAPFVASENASIPVINAGDGGHCHPTQTLADLLTIYRRYGRLNDITVGFCGDLKYGRTVHSLIGAMSRYSGVRFVLISPEELKLPEFVKKEYIDDLGIDCIESTSLEDSIPELDVLYMTRVQGERFADQNEYLRLRDRYILTPDKLANAKKELSILHPLPRVNEISVKIDDDPRACYFKQVKNGKLMRMALILKLLEDAKNPVKVDRITGDVVKGKYVCPNHRCITTTEQELEQAFKYDKDNNVYRCIYCETEAR
jgi:aspartate carbamoyltransferase catalytic subunit